MRIKIAILAAAVIFGIATSSPNAAQPSIATVYVPTASKVYSVDNDVAAKSDLCNILCWIPWHGCVDKCGGTQSCKLECNYLLFHDPDLSCPSQGCVPAPKSCSKSKQHVAASFNSHEHDSQAGAVIERHINTAHTAPELPTTNKESGNDLNVSMPPPILPCINCWDAIEMCKRECDTPGCAAKCVCIESARNVNCEMCGIKCKGKGSTKSTSALEYADLDLRVPIPPPNINPCVYCHSAIYNCSKRCDSEACKTVCACMHKQYNRNCKECKVNCKCGDDLNCSGSLQVAVRDTNVLPPPHPNPCLNCQYSINACRKKCKIPGVACNDACSCKEKRHNPNCRWCKIDQNCAASLEKSSIDTNILSPVPNLCPLCYLSIKDCKNNCKKPGFCDAACVCIEKVHNPHCRQCRIKCDCEVDKLCASEMKLVRRSEGVEQFKAPHGDVEPAGLAGSFEPILDLKNPPHCRECTWRFQQCIRRCFGPGKCHDDCKCETVEKYTACKLCSLKCPSRSSIERRIEDTLIGGTPTISLRGPVESCFICHWEASYFLSKKCPPQAPCGELCNCDVIRYFPFCEKLCNYKCGESAMAELASTLKPNSDELELEPSIPTANKPKDTWPKAPVRRNDKPMDDTPATKTVEIDTAIPPTIRPPNQCELCLQSFHNCRKNICVVPGGCNDTCECWVAHMEQCQKCPFKCGILLTRG